VYLFKLGEKIGVKMV